MVVFRSLLVYINYAPFILWKMEDWNTSMALVIFRDGRVSLVFHCMSYF